MASSLTVSSTSPAAPAAWRGVQAWVPWPIVAAAWAVRAGSRPPTAATVRPALAAKTPDGRADLAGADDRDVGQAGHTEGEAKGYAWSLRRVKLVAWAESQGALAGLEDGITTPCPTARITMGASCVAGGKLRCQEGSSILALSFQAVR